MVRYPARRAAPAVALHRGHAISLFLDSYRLSPTVCHFSVERAEDIYRLGPTERFVAQTAARQPGAFAKANVAEGLEPQPDFGDSIGKGKLVTAKAVPNQRRPLVQGSSPPARVVINSVEPEIENGRFPIKRVVGEEVVVTADIFADGHDALSAVLRYRHARDLAWTEIEMDELVNDRWAGSFRVTSPGLYQYTLEAWVDRFKSWRRDFKKRAKAGQAAAVDLLIGAQLARETGRRAASKGAQKDAARLEEWAVTLEAACDADQETKASVALDPGMAELAREYPDRHPSTIYDAQLEVAVDPERSRASAWYEVFPRSCGPSAEVHGTFRDLEERLPYIASMGFDVVYLPPIHPIGTTFRKGKNNHPVAAPGDVGSPWAIGSAEGGHKAIDSRLGTLEDFRHLVGRARELSLDVALDIAYQCTPDHPYVKEHPEWFVRRPDGAIQYAENPPKKYQDIYPVNFENENWRGLWEELKSVVGFWREQGVRIFRVDNPHTKPFAFWEWMIGEIKREHPEVIFLAEAFTRPKVMYRLAKLGFTHSYTYFTWRNSKQEITEYFTELSQPPVRDFFRPHLWPNTPDILHAYLQAGGRPAFMARLVLAATLGANYGIYGGAFEVCENRPLAPGSEEYLNAEKYEIKHWDLDRADSLKDFISRVNLARRENPALRADRNLRFHTVDNDQLIAYTKVTDDLLNVVLTVVNLDSHHRQWGFVTLPLTALDIDATQPYQVQDLITGARYQWKGPTNYVELDPNKCPAHIFRVRRRARTEENTEYFV